MTLEEHEQIVSQIKHNFGTTMIQVRDYMSSADGLHHTKEIAKLLNRMQVYNAQLEGEYRVRNMIIERMHNYKCDEG